MVLGVVMRNCRNWLAAGLAVIGLAGVTGPTAPARAADLTLTLEELARVLTATLDNPTVRLHNLPGGGAGSSLNVGKQALKFDVPPQTFETSGVKYAYYVNDLNAQRVTITHAPSVVRITVTFEADKTEIVGRCDGGLCPSSSVLPQIEWIAPTATIDFTPVWADGNLALDIKRVAFGGTFTPQCPPAGGFFSGSLCRLLLPKAQQEVAKLDTLLGDRLKDFINSPDMQARIATGLRPFLRFGPIGEVRFSRVSVDADLLTLSFCLVCQTL